MAEFSREKSQEYWRPVSASGSPLQKLGGPQSAEFCTICGTQFSPGGRFCNQCGLNRYADLHAKKRSPLLEWIDMDGIHERTGLSTISMVLVILAGFFALATVMTGMVYNTATIAEWQAVQTWRIEWLLAMLASLLAAILFKKV
jgi:hypothetical protein